MIYVKDYNLPDSSILDCETNTCKIWIPETICIVLGISNQPDDALFTEIVEMEEIPVYKRSTGGQTVVLSPNTIVISLLLCNCGEASPKEIFHVINTEIIAVLEKTGIQNLNERGISDIAILEKKILGSAMYRKKEKAFYHAVLNYCESGEIFSKYLKHPTKEPDYRKGRPHSDFVTSLKNEGISISINELRKILMQKFVEKFNTKDEYICVNS